MNTPPCFYAKHTALTEASLTSNSSNILEWWIYRDGLLIVRSHTEAQSIPGNADISCQYQLSNEEFSVVCSILEQDLPHICPNMASALSYWEMQSFAPDGTPLHGFYGGYITSSALQHLTDILFRCLPPSVSVPMQNASAPRKTAHPGRRSAERPTPNRNLCGVAAVVCMIVFCILFCRGFLFHCVRILFQAGRELENTTAYTLSVYTLLETVCMVISPLFFALGRPWKPRKTFLLTASGAMILKHFFYTVNAVDTFGIGMLLASISFFVILLLILSESNPAASTVPFAVILVPIVLLCLGFWLGDYPFPSVEMSFLGALFTFLFFYLLMFCSADKTKSAAQADSPNTSPEEPDFA